MTISQELFQKAGTLIPGGVNSPVRPCKSVHCDPLFVASASGSKLTTEDGAEALYSGHVIEGEQWVGRYLVWMSTKDYYDKEIAENELWSKMYEVFKRENLELYKPE